MLHIQFVMTLVEITETARFKSISDLSDLIKAVMSSTAELYASVGYVPPWIGYLAFEENMCVGTCAFKSPPENRRVEIAYFTFPGHEGQVWLRAWLKHLCKWHLSQYRN